MRQRSGAKIQTERLAEVREFRLITTDSGSLALTAPMRLESRGFKWALP